MSTDFEKFVENYEIDDEPLHRNFLLKIIDDSVSKLETSGSENFDALKTTVRALLELGEDPQKKDFIERTALSVALETSRDPKLGLVAMSKFWELYDIMLEYAKIEVRVKPETNPGGCVDTEKYLGGPRKLIRIKRGNEFKTIGK